MTVQELIGILNDMPSDAIVFIGNRRSDPEVLQDYMFIEEDNIVELMDW